MFTSLANGPFAGGRLVFGRNGDDSWSDFPTVDQEFASSATFCASMDNSAALKM